jgi:hypothetical protein
MVSEKGEINLVKSVLEEILMFQNSLAIILKKIINCSYEFKKVKVMELP